jgi:hypothetical protein
VVVIDIQRHPRPAPLLGRQARHAAGGGGVAIDEAVDAPVQADAVLPGGREMWWRRAAHEITQQVADQRAAGVLGKQRMGKHVQDAAPQGCRPGRMPARVVIMAAGRGAPRGRSFAGGGCLRHTARFIPISGFAV